MRSDLGPEEEFVSVGGDDSTQMTIFCTIMLSTLLKLNEWLRLTIEMKIGRMWVPWIGRTRR
jgi:hypothetical protein